MDDNITHAVNLCRTIQDLNYNGLSKDAADDFIDSLLYFLIGETEHTHVKAIKPKPEIRKEDIRETSYEEFKQLMESKNE